MALVACSRPVSSHPGHSRPVRVILIPSQSVSYRPSRRLNSFRSGPHPFHVPHHVLRRVRQNTSVSRPGAAVATGSSPVLFSPCTPSCLSHRAVSSSRGSLTRPQSGPPVPRTAGGLSAAAPTEYRLVPSVSTARPSLQRCTVRLDSPSFPAAVSGRARQPVLPCSGVRPGASARPSLQRCPAGRVNPSFPAAVSRFVPSASTARPSLQRCPAGRVNPSFPAAVSGRARQPVLPCSGVRPGATARSFPAAVSRPSRQPVLPCSGVPSVPTARPSLQRCPASA